MGDATLLLLGIWLALSGLVAWLGLQRGRSALGFFVLAALLSPLVAYAVLVALPDRALEEERRTALERAARELIDGPRGGAS